MYFSDISGIHKFSCFCINKVVEMHISWTRRRYHEKMKHYMENPELAAFRDLTKELFRRNGFYVTELHYEHIIPDEQFRSILNKDFSKTEVAKIVRFSPDFFVLHDDVEPVLGTFFLVCSLQSEPVVLERDRLRCYREYYPYQRIAIASLGKSRVKDKKIVYCEWLNNFRCSYSGNTAKLYAKKCRTLPKFLESELHIQSQGAEINMAVK